MTTTIQTKLNKLAEQLLDEATRSPKKGGEPALATKERVEIFKAASAWELGITKAKKGEDDPGGAESSFNAIRDRVNGGPTP